MTEKRGRGRPKGSSVGPKKPDPRRDVHDPGKPKCGKPYIFRGIERTCGKRGYHWKCGPGKG